MTVSDAITRLVVDGREQRYPLRDEVLGGFEALGPAYRLGARDALAIARGLQQAFAVQHVDRGRDACVGLANCIERQLARRVEDLVSILAEEAGSDAIPRLRLVKCNP